MGAEQALPNIILIATDQHRSDCLGLAGHPVLQTPNLDFLGASGTFFRSAYAESPSCIPARRTLISGQAPSANGMVGFQEGVAWDPPHTIAGELSKAGYQCEMVGKMHLWPQRKRYGFHRMALADSTRGPNNDYLDWLSGEVPTDRWAMAHGVSPNGWIARPTHLHETQTHTFWCISQAIEFLEKRDPEMPYFLYVGFIDPHPPLTPPGFYYDRYARQELPAPVIGDWIDPDFRPRKGQDPEGPETRAELALDDAAMHDFRAGYYGLINHVDDQVGRLLQYLRDTTLLDETFMLFTSDHGEMLGDHHMLAKVAGFDGAARIPFLARAPRSFGLPSGTIVDAPVGLQDVLATLVDAAGMRLPATVTGRSVLPLMAGSSAGIPPWRDVLHGEHAPAYAGDYGMHYLVDGHVKYIWHTQSGREFFFDLDGGAGEERNLIDDPAWSDQVAAFRHRLIEILTDRVEGFVDRGELVAGRPYHALTQPVPPAA